MRLKRLTKSSDSTDILFLRTDFSENLTESPIDIVTDPKRITGIQKAIQMYTNLLLTHTGSVLADPDVGTDVYFSVKNGNISNTADLTHAFLVANAAVLDLMRNDVATGMYGDLDPEDIIESVDLNDIIVDTTTASVTIDADVTTEAGSEYSIAIPIR